MSRRKRKAQAEAPQAPDAIETLKALDKGEAPQAEEMLELLAESPVLIDNASAGRAFVPSADMTIADETLREQIVQADTFVPPAPRVFEYMKEDAHWFSLLDYGHVYDVVKAIRPRRVLEFGPGPSTLALVEGGAVSVDTCEDVEDWARVWDERLVKRFPGVVRQHRYSWPTDELLSIPTIDGQRFDLGFIDGPHGTERRPGVLSYCLEHCTWVLMPAEEWQTRPVLRPLIEAIAREAGRPVTFTTTGPLSGAFALVGPA